ncbi:MAG: hypothetical protein HYY76_14115 [Acidobacteria bacterium]|nr:hypothetical protein [Acidobacteriota bacterium]
MTSRPLVLLASVVLLGGLAVVTVSCRAGTPEDATQRTTTLRTPWGEPDLQGIWNGETITPLERPARWADKPVLSAEEAAAVEKWVA